MYPVGSINDGPSGTQDVNVTNSIGDVYVVPPNTTTVEYTGNQTGVTLLTPTSGKRLQIIGIFVSSDDATFTFELSFGTSGITVYKLFESGSLGQSPPMNITGATNEVLTVDISDSVGQNWFVLVNYVEVD